MSVHMQRTDDDTLKEGTFNGLWQLKELVIVKCALKVIESNTFQSYGLEELETLNLQDNKIRLIYSVTFEPNTFYGMDWLNSLSLRNNLLETLPMNLFKNLHTLQKIDLQGNQLKILSNNIFSNLGSFYEISINLNFNQIKYLSPQAFENKLKISEGSHYESQFGMMPVCTVTIYDDCIQDTNLNLFVFQSFYLAIQNASLPVDLDMN
ncbi:leucine-rich repeat-containing protein 15-like [Chrysoperla carnea]|uniref:leucine-rich repeat-containing protein 15-like n=1 Tax=Chrysoperla carnea TaxID=189513 RepID=UPI001D07BF90|nr:leucine-rich repeat-containing protein 15-like [Chrysoperla carnea]